MEIDSYIWRKRKKNKEKMSKLVAIHFLYILVYIVKDISSGYFCSRWDRFAPTWKDRSLLSYYMKKSKQFKKLLENTYHYDALYIDKVKIYILDSWFSESPEVKLVYQRLQYIMDCKLTGLVLQYILSCLKEIQ